MNPANNLEILHDQIVALNRTLKMSSEEKVTQGGHTWVFRGGKEAIPLADIQKIIPKNLKFDNQQENLRSAVELLHNQVQQLYEDTPAKQVVLQRLTGLLPTRVEAMLDEIEKHLPPDCFAPFKRDEHGKLIEPEKQLEEFRALLNRNPLHLELTDTAEKPLTAQDYIHAAKRVVDHDFIATFGFYLPAELRTENKANEAREFIKGVEVNFLIFDAKQISVISPEIAVLNKLKLVSFRGNVQINSKMLPPSITGIFLNNWPGNTVPDWIYAIPNLRNITVENLKFELNRLSQITKIIIGIVPPGTARKEPLPPELFDAKHLTGLSLHNVSSEPLPAAVGNLVNLESLDIRYNQFRTLPPEIGNLSALKNLFIEHNLNLSQLPAEIGKLRNLEELSILDQSLETLPEEIGDLSNLKTLNLSRIKNFLQFPDSLGKLKKLEQIKCDGQYIHLLPDTLVNCSRLVRITSPDRSHEWSKGDNIPLKDFLKAARLSAEKQP